jgi:non-ribosomal peptide synthetase component F
LRTDLSGDPTVTELLGRVRKVALEAYAHQDVTFEKIVQALKPKRDAGHPLFRVMFGLRTELDHLEIADLGITRMRLKTGTIKFDLSLGMAETERGLAASLRYRDGLFEDSTIKRLLEELQSLLAGMAAHPQRRISELSSLKVKGVPGA